MWNEMAHALASEFSDLADTAQVTRIVSRLVLAALLGGVLGLQRERHGKAAGARTHMLVALGAALFVLVPEQAGVPTADVTRVIQGVVVGIGFLGAGTIIKRDFDANVEGLTTAADIWLTAAIGIACGFGREATALLSALLALAILALVPHVRRIGDR
ncbi:MAG: MgtC/SapB family protein [Caldimonas sp.]